jgi:hypothetical protein
MQRAPFFREYRLYVARTGSDLALTRAVQAQTRLTRDARRGRQSGKFFFPVDDWESDR